jgi:hypothetical protein
LIECRLKAAAWSAGFINKAGANGARPKKVEEPCVIWSAVRVEAIAASRAAVPDALDRVVSRPKYAILRSSCC